MSSERIVPGEVLGVEEEYVDGKNTYIDSSGVLRSAVVGVPRPNSSQKVIDVEPVRRLRAPLKGSTVVGMVYEIRENLAFVELWGEVSLEPRPRWLFEYSGSLTGVLTPEQIGMDRRDDIYSYVRPLDVIIARVMSSISPYLLSLRGQQLGVIYATCSKCGELMNPSGSTFVCPRCGNVEKRKMSPLASSRLLRIDLRRLALPH